MNQKLRTLFLSIVGLLPIPSVSMAASSRLITIGAQPNDTKKIESVRPMYHSTDQLDRQDRDLLRSIIPPYQAQASFLEMSNRLSILNPQLSADELQKMMLDSVLILKNRGVIDFGISGAEGPTSR